MEIGGGGRRGDTSGAGAAVRCRVTCGVRCQWPAWMLHQLLAGRRREEGTRVVVTRDGSGAI